MTASFEVDGRRKCWIGGQSRFSVDMTVSNNRDVQMGEGGALARAKVRRARISGVVDSGASDLILPKKLVDELGLPSAGKGRVKYTNEGTAVRDKVQEARVELLGREGTFMAIVEPKRKDALIGAIVLESLDYLVDPRMQKLVPRDPKMTISELGSSLHER